MFFTQKKSRIGGSIGAELNELRAEISSLQPQGNQMIRANRTTRGVSWLPTAELLRRGGGNVDIDYFTVVTTYPHELTCTQDSTGDTVTILKPAGPKSESNTRTDVGDTANWHPRDGAQSSRSYHYMDEHHRYAIIHGSAELYILAGNATVDYLKQIQKLDPFYTAGDAIVATKVNGVWTDINMAGRHWRDATTIASSEPDRALAAGIQSDQFVDWQTFRYGGLQDVDQVYSNDNPDWKTGFSASAFAQY